MRAIVLLLAVVGAQADVQSKLGDLCDLFDKMADDQQDVTPEQMQAIGAKFAGLFVKSIDCSEDPYNPIIGYNLHDVAFPKCMEAKQKAEMQHKETQFELKKMKCIEKIADEKAKTGALWMELSNTGEFKKQFTLRAGIRYSFDDDYKITAWHAVYDSYHMLDVGNKVQKGLDNICTLFDRMADDTQDLSAGEMKEIGAKFAGLFAKNVDCSEDPYNPIIGFNEHDTTFPKCMAAKTQALTQGKINMEMKKMKCIETIPDEQGKTGALWFEMSNTGKFMKEFTVRAAVRYHFNDDGLISAWHAIYDSYHFLHGNDERLDSEVTITGLGKTSMPAVAVSAIALAATFAVGLFVGRRASKHYVALTDEEQQQS